MQFWPVKFTYLQCIKTTLDPFRISLWISNRRIASLINEILLWNTLCFYPDPEEEFVLVYFEDKRSYSIVTPGNVRIETVIYCFV